MNIFITGASGFVGGAAASWLRARGHEIAAMSRSAASDEKIARLGATPVRGALGAASPEMLAGCEAVVHAAAYVEEWGPYEAYYEANVTGTRQLLEAARAAGVRRFVHIGTEAALFRGQDLLDIDETYPYPDTPFYYSRTKQEAEKAVLAANEPGRFETISLRPRLIWGPGDQTVLPVVKEKVERNQFVWIDGGAYRTSTTYIDNLSHAIELALTAGAGGNAYFVTDGEIQTFRDFITRYLATAGVEIRAGSMPRGLVRVAGAGVEALWRLLRLRSTPPITRFAACILSSHCVLRDDKARRDLGYRPVVTVTEGMARMTGIPR